jgi:hypothetical protein
MQMILHPVMSQFVIEPVTRWLTVWPPLEGVFWPLALTGCQVPEFVYELVSGDLPSIDLVLLLYI